MEPDKPPELNPGQTGMGLSSDKAQRRLQAAGPNALPEPSTHPVLLFLGKFWAPVPWMLEATVVLELILGKRPEAAVIGALLFFNGLVSVVQERKAANALALLRKSGYWFSAARELCTWFASADISGPRGQAACCCSVAFLMSRS